MIEILIEHETKTLQDGEIFVSKTWEPLDLDSNVGFTTFSMNLKQSDVNDPTSIFTNYSKSFSIPGTKRNLNLINYINRTDATRSKNKTKKCLVNNNGLLIDRGYIRIETITETNGMCVISCTFYSELCNLFNNLKVDSNNEAYRMNDMFYGLYDKVNDDRYTSIVKEKTEYSFEWSAENITDLINDITSHGDDPDYVLDDTKNKYAVLPVFSHDGYQDDFANNKTLMFMGPPGSTSYMPDNLLKKLGQEGTQGISAETMCDYVSNTNGWACFETARDLSAVEAKCYNTKRLKIAVRNSVILDAICNPVNNGGYNLYLSKGVKDSFYYKDTFCIFDNITEEEYDQAVTTTKKWPEDDPEVFAKPVRPFSPLEFKYTTPIDLTVYNNPKLKFPVPELNFNLEENGPRYLFLNRGPRMGSKFNSVSFLVNIYVGNTAGTIKNLAKSILYSTKTDGVSAFAITSGGSSNSPFYRVESYKSVKYVLLEQMNSGTLIRFKDRLYENVQNALEVTGDYMYDDKNNTGHYKFITQEENITVDLKNYIIPDETEQYIYYELIPICFDSNGAVENITVFCNEENEIPSQLVGFWGSTDVFTLQFSNKDDGFVEPYLVIPEDSMVLYDSTVIGSYNTAYNKEVLFTHLKCTPADYLLSFTKLLNLKFYYGVDGSIQILTNKEYYSYLFEHVESLDSILDKSKTIEYKITPYDSKTYKYAYKDNDTYADYLINKTTGKHPNTVIVTTDNEGHDEKNVLDKLIWTNCLDYRFNTPYVGSEANPSSPISDGNYVYINQWSGSGNPEMETKDSILVRLRGEHFVEDDNPMLCFFDNKFEPVEDNITLQFFYGAFINYVKSFEELIQDGEIPDTDEELKPYINKLYCLVDKMPVMEEMSGEKECYVRVNYKDLRIMSDKVVQRVPKTRTRDSRLTSGTIYVPQSILYFTNVHTSTYGSNRTITTCLNYDNNNIYLSKFSFGELPKTIFEAGLNHDATNLYSSEQIEIKATCVISCDNNVNDMLRKIYKFNSSFWYINEISNLKIVDNKYVGTFTFMKLLNWNSYINFEFGVNDVNDVL